jgi:predicted transcriptional regulator
LNDLTATDLIDATARIVTAYVGGNAIAPAELSGLIQSTHAALAALTRAAQPAAEPAPNLHKSAAAIRQSIRPGHLVSFIDGKPYRMLRRHLRTNGMTPEEYRARFGLPVNYPMVAADYAEQRRALAVSIGLGRKAGAR